MEKNKVTIVTHDNKFHRDDIFAVAVLMMILEQDHNVAVIRTRDPEIISRADYVVDVGGVSDPDKNRFDHHQQGGAGVRENDIPYSALGLVWKKFGEIVCGGREIADSLEQSLVQTLDADDNGIYLYEPKIPGVYPYELSDFFRALVPSWKEGFDHVDDSFMEAVSYAKVLLEREIIKHRDKFEARGAVEEAYKNAPDKRLIVLDTYYPSGEFLSKFPEPLFVVFPRNDGVWVLDTIQKDEISFTPRKNLPKTWAGKRDKELEDVT